METPDTYASWAQDALDQAHTLTDSAVGLLATGSKRTVAAAAVPIAISLVRAGFYSVLTVASAIQRQRL